MEVIQQRSVNTKPDFLPLHGTDYIELYVGNAKQVAHYYRTAFGFQPLAYAGPETGRKDKASYVLIQNKIRLVLTTPLKPIETIPPGEGKSIADHIYKHGDGVKIIALTVDDAEDAWEQTTARGAHSHMKPLRLQDEDGMVVLSGIKTFGETVHLFVERKDYKGIFMPGYKPWSTLDFSPQPTGLLHVDHCVANVSWGQMDKWVSFYQNVMGFANILSFDDKDISTEYSALMSKVMSSGNGHVKFPINEPAEGKRKSQVEEFLEYYNGEGVQHIALATSNIIQTVTKLRSRGVEFLPIPYYYYTHLQKRVGDIDEEIKMLKELNILVDRDEEGYLLQIFTKPLTDRPTFFFEIIQRKGAKSFGKGNFKALFEAIEREQAARGNL